MMTLPEIKTVLKITSQNAMFCGYYLSKNVLFNINNPQLMADELEISIDELALLFAVLRPGLASADSFDEDVDRIVRSFNLNEASFLLLMFNGICLDCDPLLN